MTSKRLNENISSSLQETILIINEILSHWTFVFMRVSTITWTAIKNEIYSPAQVNKYNTVDSLWIIDIYELLIIGICCWRGWFCCSCSTRNCCCTCSFCITCSCYCTCSCSCNSCIGCLIEFLFLRKLLLVSHSNTWEGEIGLKAGGFLMSWHLWFLARWKCSRSSFWISA